jgi:hypothetical protein
MNEQELMQKLALSKAIMDKSDTIKKGSLPPTSLQEFDVPNAKYNIPQGMLQEDNYQQPQHQQPYLSSIPNTKPVGLPTAEAIKNSKLPDEIKRLMMEHPIAQPQQMAGATLSNELIEKAARLMQDNKSGYLPESAKKQTTQTTQKTEKSSGLNMSQIKEMIEDAVNNALKENGLLVESTEKANEVFTFKVGKHIFEGKVTKIKKLS